MLILMNNSFILSLVPLAAVFVVFAVIRSVVAKRQSGATTTTPGTTINEDSDTKGNALLLSGTTTTGWSDWAQGELWLLPDGLLRSTSGLLETASHTNGPVVGSVAKRGYFDTSKINEILEKHKTNVYINTSEVKSFKLKQGWATGKLSISLNNGQVKKFSFMRTDMDYDLVGAQLYDHELFARVTGEGVPSRTTVTTSCFASALVTLTPTPCRPPEKL